MANVYDGMTWHVLDTISIGGLDWGTSIRNGAKSMKSSSMATT